LSKQLLRSGTSVGANIEEAIGGFSKKDFIYKLQTSYKELRESSYWIRLLRDADILEVATANSLLKETEEIRRILVSILKTAKQ